MNKIEITNGVAADVGLPPKIVAGVIHSFLHHIVIGVTLGKTMHWLGFGKFSKVTHPSRWSWDINNKRRMKLPAIDYIKFEAGQSFRDTVRGK